jgi:hypothetical protein
VPRATREPRRHSKLYATTVQRLIQGDPALSAAIMAVENLMIDHRLTPLDLARVVKYVEERQRWRLYNDTQHLVSDESVEVEDYDSEDEEGLEA